MIPSIINIVLPVFIVTSIGYFFGKLKKIDLASINDFVIYITTPSLILSSLAKDPIEIFLAGKVFASVIVIVAASLIVGYFIIRSLNLPIKVYLPPLVFANTGNMGLPLLLYAFGNDGFKIGIIYMVSMIILHYSLGIMILSFDKSPFELFRLPLLYSAIVGIVVSVSGWSLPAYLERALHLLGEASIPAMIFSLGYKLSEVNVMHFKKSLAFGGMRIGIGFALGMVITRLFNISGLASNVVILESSMPPAVFNFVLAEKYNQDPKTVASIILVGTILSVITTPLIIFFLLK